MKLFIAVVISLAFEALTYTEYMLSVADSIKLIGYSELHSDVISLLPVATFKAFIITSMLLSKNNKTDNVLILILSLFAIADCIILALFLNSSMYDILIEGKRYFGFMYRLFEMACLFINAVYIGRFMFSGCSGARGKSAGGTRVGGET